jgi:hypothetical protein
MKKKQTKKLVLAKETVSSLNVMPGQAAGGTTTATDDCPYTFDLTCGQTNTCPIGVASRQKCPDRPL